MSLLPQSALRVIDDHLLLLVRFESNGAPVWRSPFAHFPWVEVRSYEASEDGGRQRRFGGEVWWRHSYAGIPIALTIICCFWGGATTAFSAL
jgi:hypothetical protein